MKIQAAKRLHIADTKGERKVSEFMPHAAYESLRELCKSVHALDAGVAVDNVAADILNDDAMTFADLRSNITMIAMHIREASSKKSLLILQSIKSK